MHKNNDKMDISLKNKERIILILSLLLVFIMSGCKNKNNDNTNNIDTSSAQVDALDNGGIVRQALPFPGEFTQITSIGSLNVVYTQGEKCSVEVEGPKKLVEIVKISVDSGTLMATINLENNPNLNMFENKISNLTLYVSSPILRIVSPCGNGSFKAIGTVRTDDLVAGTLGDGGIEFDTIYCDSFRFEGKNASSSSIKYVEAKNQIELLGDSKSTLDANINSKGSTVLTMSNNSTCNVHGVSNSLEILAFNNSKSYVDVATEKLDISAYNSGEVYFSGSYKSKSVKKANTSVVEIKQ